jgi:signal transduction histidine kinase
MTPAGDLTPDASPDPLESGPGPSHSRWLQLLEAERQSIAGDLHDELLPYLFAAAGSLASLQRQNPELKDSLQQPAQWIDRAREIARQIMNGAALPGDLSAGPLVAAKQFLDSVVLANDDSRSLAIQWKHLDASAQFTWDETQLIAVYRIVCEAVRNVIRHANASELVVRWEATESGWVVSIQDNGSGFDVETVSQSSHGIPLMRERARAAGLHFQIIGAEGQTGTQVIVFKSP